LVDNHQSVVYDAEYLLMQKGVMQMINQPKIADAIESASTELRDIQQQLEQFRRLGQRAKQLEDFIALGRVLIGEVQTADTPESPAQTEPPRRRFILRPRGKRTVAACVREVLEERQRPMRLLEITQELLDRKWVKGKWAREVIRTALNRGDEFERIVTGVYALKHWPDTLKRWPGTESFPLYQDSADKPWPNGSLPDNETEGAYQIQDHD
jgi:hypothetical protein